jgi:hypothetical protein
MIIIGPLIRREWLLVLKEAASPDALRGRLFKFMDASVRGPTGCEPPDAHESLARKPLLELLSSLRQAKPRKRLTNSQSNEQKHSV